MRRIVAALISGAAFLALSASGEGVRSQSAAASRSIGPGPGEIEVDGAIDAISDAQGTLTLRASGVTLPDGTSRIFDRPRAKTVSFKGSRLSVRGRPDYAVNSDHLALGLAVSAIGRDQGPGSRLSARLILLMRDPMMRDPMTRDPMTRDPTTRDPTTRDPTTRDPGNALGNPSPPEAANPGVRVALLPTLADRILAFGTAHIGQKVGDGQCATFVDEALRYAGALSLDDFPRGNTAYVWGRLVWGADAHGGQVRTMGPSTPGTVLPGDVIQFENTTFRHVEAAGNYSSYEIQSLPHHTAIVYQPGAAGKGCTMLEQNTNGRDYVSVGRIDLNYLTEGTLRIYRCLPR